LGCSQIIIIFLSHKKIIHMKIGYLAWGSLLWNNSTLNLSNEWKKINVNLPLNFSRISDNGKGRLTLVIDNENGINNKIYFAPTDVDNLNLAIKNLRLREKTTSKNIGYINLKKNDFRSNQMTPKQLESIKNYAKKNKYDAIVWTDLPSNFSNITRKKFTINEALDYINSKYGTQLFGDIIEYILMTKIYGKINSPITKEVMKIKI